MILAQLDEHLCSIIGVFPVGLSSREAMLNLFGDVGTIRNEDRSSRRMLSYQLQVISKAARLFLANHINRIPLSFCKGKKPADWIYQLGILGIDRKWPILDKQAC